MERSVTGRGLKCRVFRWWPNLGSETPTDRWMEGARGVISGARGDQGVVQGLPVEEWGRKGLRNATWCRVLNEEDIEKR